MEIASAITIGAIALLIGALFRALMDYESIKPAAPRELRSEALFRQLYLGPDFIMLAVALLSSSAGIESLLKGAGKPSTLGDEFPFWFWVTMLSYLGALIACALLWLFAGDAKYIPIQDRSIKFVDRNGAHQTKTVPCALWREGLVSQASVMTLWLGNLIGVGCVAAFWVFATRAFK